MFEYLFEQPTDRLRQQRAIAQRYTGNHSDEHG
jgi:hypothetical protein